MNEMIAPNEDLTAGLIRSQIGAWQNLLYCLENNTVDSQYLVECIKMLGRKNQQIIKYYEQVNSLESALAVSFR